MNQVVHSHALEMLWQHLWFCIYLFLVSSLWKLRKDICSRHPSIRFKNVFTQNARFDSSVKKKKTAYIQWFSDSGSVHSLTFPSFCASVDYICPLRSYVSPTRCSTLTNCSVQARPSHPWFHVNRSRYSELKYTALISR